MTGNGTRDEALAVALAAGHDVKTAASLANMSERTARRKMADPEYRARVQAIQKARLDKVCRMLNKASLAATRKLVELLDSGSPEVALRAATAILDRGVKLRGETLFRDKLYRGLTSLEALLERLDPPHA